MYQHLNNLIIALTSDPDLASIHKDNLASTFQVLFFLATGCDYNSYFKSILSGMFSINMHFLSQARI